MIKRLASCVREFKRDSILAPLCVTMEVVMEVVIPLLMARLIDNGINAGNMPYLIKMGIFLALCRPGISMLFGALSGRFAAALRRDSPGISGMIYTGRCRRFLLQISINSPAPVSSRG